MLQFICFLLAVIFAAIATANVPSPPRFQYLPFAIAMLALGMILGGTMPLWR